jgi:hypothetical protein
MPLSADFDHRTRFVFTRASGDITLSEIEEHLDEEEREGGLSYPEIIDARQGTGHLSPADIRRTVAQLRLLRTRHSLGPTAIVVQSDFDFAMVRMLSILSEDICQVEVFRNLPDAEQWLGSLPRAP